MTKTARRDRLQAMGELFDSKPDSPLEALFEQGVSAGHYPPELLEELGRIQAINELRTFINARNPKTGKRRGYHWLQTSFVVEDGKRVKVERDTYVPHRYLSFEQFSSWFAKRKDQADAFDEDTRGEVVDAVDRYGRQKVRSIPGIGDFMPPQKD